MTPFRRKPGRFFRRRTRKSPYEMQEISFNREAVTIGVGGSTEQALFLICHPRLEYSVAAPTLADPNPHTLPIAKGCVVSGLKHRAQLGYVPSETGTTPTATAAGFCSVRMAICRLPTDLGLAPLLVPSLFGSDANVNSAGDVPVRARTLWRGLAQLAILDGALPLTYAFSSLCSNTAGQLGGLQDFVVTKSKVGLSMDQGLFLVVETRGPFSVWQPSAQTNLGLDFWCTYAVKQAMRGTTYP